MEACRPLFAISHPQAYSVNLLLQSTHGHWTTFPLASSRLKPAFLRAVIGIPEPQLCVNLAALGLYLSIPNLILREHAYSSPYRMLISFCRHSSVNLC